MFLTSRPADFCLTSTGPALLSAWFCPAPEPSLGAHGHDCRCSRTTCCNIELSPAAVRVLSSQAPHLEGDRMGAGMGAALTLVPRGLLPAEHIGTGANVLGNFSKLRHALYLHECCSLLACKTSLSSWESSGVGNWQEGTASHCSPKPHPLESKRFGNADFMWRDAFGFPVLILGKKGLTGAQRKKNGMGTHLEVESQSCCCWFFLTILTFVI